jgi:hypothetical protein
MGDTTRVRADVTHPFSRPGVRQMKPTLKHRAAVWNGILGTMYAMSPEGVIRYFDYAWDEAVAFAQLGEDLRVYRADRQHPHHSGYRARQMVLWTR